MQVTRSYTKRASDKSLWDGQVHDGVTFAIEGKNTKFLVNGNELPEVSAQYLMNFALQSLQDAYAGAKDLAEAQANFQKKLDALLEGSIGIREGGGVSEEIRIRRQFVMDAVRAAARKKEGKPWKETEKKAEYDALSDEEINAKLDYAFEKNASHFGPLVAEKLAELKAAREARLTARSAAIDLDI